MSTVLLDNWLLFNCITTKMYNMNDEELPGYGSIHLSNKLIRKDVTEQCWQNLVTSLVLWDDIYFNIRDRSHSSYDRYFTHKLLGSFLMDNKNIHILDRNYIPFYEPDVGTARKLYDSIHSENKDYDTIELLFRGYLYLLDAAHLGYNYLPHPYRAKVFKESKIYQEGMFSGKDIMIRLDKDIKEFLDRINEEFQRPIIPTKFPVLYQYIKSNSNSPHEELALALSLRDSKSVSQFRNSINRIDKAISNGDYVELSEVLKTVDDVCNDVAKELSSKSHTTTVSIDLIPVPSIGISTDVTFQKRNNSKLHTAFLYDLTEFALRGKRPQF